MDKKVFTVIIKKINILHLFLVLTIGVVGLIFAFRNSAEIQFKIVVIITLLYVVSALIHHHFDKSLTLEIILEYILVAALVLILLSSIFI